MRLSQRWLSSQILLVVVAGWVIGLAAIHHAWLVPSIQSQLARQESSAAVRWIEQGLAGLARERNDLGQRCRRLADDPPAIARLVSPRNNTTPATAPDSSSRDANVAVVVCSADRTIARMSGWMGQGSVRPGRDGWQLGQSLDNSPVFPPAWQESDLTGLASVGGRTCLFAREAIGDGAAPGDKGGWIVLVRPIDWPMLQELSDVSGVQVMVVDSPRRETAGNADNAIEHWSTGSGSLSATAALKDSLGRPIAQLQVSGSTIDLNSSAASMRGGYMVQLLWLIGSALVTFVVIYLLFIRPLAILVRRLSARDVTDNRDRLASGLFAETGILARKFSDVMGRIVTLSETDPLTGLTNRRQFRLLLEHEFNLSLRHNAPLAVLMIDVDFFKQVNDKYGHLVGDEVLTMVARTIQDAVRKTDVSGRYGGEEFAVVLPRTSMDQAAVLGERIRDEILRRVVMHEQDLVKVTVSVGVASMPQMACRRPEDLLNFADQAMYVAKRAGRNRTELASEMNAETQAQSPLAVSRSVLAAVGSSSCQNATG
jgi:diguanylate cyclase (GGDEF)-like protein